MPRIYAAVANGDCYFSALGAARYPYVLVSFARPELAGKVPYKPRSLLTDSGAFTTWQKGEQVDLAAYIAWCEEQRAERGKADTLHISLDVIPGKRGRTPTKRQAKAGMDQSLGNGDRIREAGLPVMEVYHQLEPPAFLDLLLDRMAPGDILGISPRQAGPSMHSRLRFCDGVFARLLERYGKELPRVHGLGLTSREAMLRYPWWSVDSLAWAMPGIWGRHQTRDGREQRDPALKGRPNFRVERCRQVLDLWQSWERDAQTLWKKRGVTWRK